MPEMRNASEGERVETGFCRRDYSFQKVSESAVHVEASENGSVRQRRSTVGPVVGTSPEMPCTCEEKGEEACERVWWCCDCHREMRHRYGDLLGRCWGCNCELDAKL